jgi:hypothetical protein
MDHPEAPVIKIRPNRDNTGFILTVLCPFCREKHTHGETLVLNKRYFGTRVSHCVKSSSQEYLLVRACSIPEESNTRIFHNTLFSGL